MIIPYATVEGKHIWQIYMTSELKLKLFCFLTIHTVVWIFVAVKNRFKSDLNRFKSFGCTKIRHDTKWTKTSWIEVMQPTTCNIDLRPICPYYVHHNQAGFDSPFINGRGFIYLGISKKSISYQGSISINAAIKANIWQQFSITWATQKPKPGQPCCRRFLEI